MNEQKKISVKFKIVELLHIYDQLTFSYDHTNDQGQKEIIEYLQNKLWEQIPNFEESENFYKSIF